MKRIVIPDEQLSKQIENLLDILYKKTILTIDIPSPKSLNDLLNGMTKLELEPKIYKFVIQEMQYVQRKDALNTYLNYTTHYLNGDDPKAGGATVLFLGTSPGVGKSRFSLELPNYLKDHYTNIGKFKKNIKMINLAIWFSNGANLDPIELDSNNIPLDLEKSIVARMIYSYIVHINPHSWYGDYISSDETTIDSCLLLRIYKDLGNIIKGRDDWMSQFCKWLVDKEQEEGKILWIHFTLDEYNHLVQSVQDKTSILNEFLDNLCRLRHLLPSVFTNLLCGTHMHDLYTLKEEHGGRIYLRRIELGNFDENEQEEMYSKQNYPLTIAKKTLFHSLGGHARLIELFGRKKNDSAEEILSYLNDFLETNSGTDLDKSSLEILIALCISRKGIPTDMKYFNGKTVKQLQRSMILFLFDSYLGYGLGYQEIVYIPILVLLKLIKKLVQLEEDHFLRVLDMDLQTLTLYNSESDLFEKFNQTFLQAKLNCLWFLMKKDIIRKINLRNIFHYQTEYCEIAMPSDYTPSEILEHQFPLSEIPLSNVIYKNGKQIYAILKSTDGRNVTDNVRWPTVASNSNLAEYYGPFSVIVSYLGCVKMKITEIDEEDFSWVFGTNHSTAIKTNWDHLTQEEKSKRLLDHLNSKQLRQLLLFTSKDDEKAVMDAIQSETDKSSTTIEGENEQK